MPLLHDNPPCTTCGITQVLVTYAPTHRCTHNNAQQQYVPRNEQHHMETHLLAGMCLLVPACATRVLLCSSSMSSLHGCTTRMVVPHVWFSTEYTATRTGCGLPILTCSFMLFLPPGIKSPRDGKLLNSMALRHARRAAFCVTEGRELGDVHTHTIYI